MRYTLLLACFLVGCHPGSSSSATFSVATNSQKSIVHIKPGPNVQEELLTALIKAKPGTVIEMAEGLYEFTASLSLTQPGVTLRGAGPDKTILSFKKQDQGKEGLIVSVGDFAAENFTLQDSKGDGIKVVGGTNVAFQKVRVRWTEGPKPTNGGYGIYPVTCTNVLIEKCEADGASDAGIYVGQSKQVIIRECKAHRNVAGIEVENSTEVDVHDNIATNNSGGILVFDLPNLPVKNGKQVRVFRNKVVGNNHDNFAPPGNIVSTVPPGTGLMILATDQVECFNNEVTQNQTTGLAIISFQLVGKEFAADKQYDPYPEGLFIHDNRFAENGSKPSGEMGMQLGMLLGKPMPDILYDGNINSKKLVDGKLPEALSLKLMNNGEATFANLHYDGGNVLKYALSKPKIDRTTTAHEGKHEPLAGIILKPMPHQQ
ncbi:MAG: parallel beta-helix domain-containing protein [Gemmatales bacterium]